MLELCLKGQNMCKLDDFGIHTKKILMKACRYYICIVERKVSLIIIVTHPKVP
jgi:hypothetical protein